MVLMFTAFATRNNPCLFWAFGQKDVVTGATFQDKCGRRPVGLSGYQSQPWLQTNASCPEPTALAAAHLAMPAPPTCSLVFEASDCMSDLNTLMVSYIGIKYCYDLPLQLIVPWLVYQWNERSSRRAQQRAEKKGEKEVIIQKSSLPPEVEM